MIGKIKNTRAFTLIELLMVISIISLLSSIVLGYVGSARAKSRDVVRLNDMQQINTAANMYRDDKNEVPDSIEMLVNTGYLSAIPKDPSTGIVYSSKSISTSKGKIFIASTTYETIKREDGENQNVGVLVGDLTLSDICLILNYTDSFPNCLSDSPTDQIVGITKGSRSGGSGTVGGLVWSDTFGPDDWYNANTTCSEWGGRLPNNDEMVSGLEDQYLPGGIGTNPGGFMELVFYWSKEEIDQDSSYACSAYNGIGAWCYDLVAENNKSTSNYFRCVK